MTRQIRKPEHQRDRRGGEQRRARAGRLHVETENVLEVGQAVVAAEAEVVAEESEHQRERQRLGDDRQIDTRHARPERKPAEHESQRARHQHDHQQRVGEVLEAVPIDRQLRPVQEHHEVRQHRIGIDAAGADLPHQVHPHRVAAEREERAVAEREDAAVAPDQVDRKRQDREAQVLAEQRDVVCRQMKRRRWRHHQVEHRHHDRDRPHHHQEDDRHPVERAQDRAGDHASTARPLRANSPRGRFWMNRMISTRMAILASTAPA